MTKRGLILIVIGWVLLTLFNYYYMNFFLLAFEWFALIFTLFIIVIVQIILMIIERKNLTSQRKLNALVFSCLFLLTFFQSIPNGIIEKIDWLLLESKRNEIVMQAKSGALHPNVTYNHTLCELPYQFPVVSNGGNDILIERNTESGTTTVKFWVFRNFFDSPSTCFIYSDNPLEIAQLEKQIAERPQYNWKIKDNWYRMYGY